MNPISQPFEYQAAAMRLAGYVLTNNLRIMQIMTRSALDAPMAQVRALQAASSVPSCQARTERDVQPEPKATAKTYSTEAKPTFQTKQAAPINTQKTRKVSEVVPKTTAPTQAPKPEHASAQKAQEGGAQAAVAPETSVKPATPDQPTGQVQKPVQKEAKTAPKSMVADKNPVATTPEPQPSRDEAANAGIDGKPTLPGKSPMVSEANRADVTTKPVAPEVSPPKSPPVRSASTKKSASKASPRRTRKPSRPPTMPGPKPKTDG